MHKRNNTKTQYKNTIQTIQKHNTNNTKTQYKNTIQTIQKHNTKTQYKNTIQNTVNTNTHSFIVAPCILNSKLVTHQQMHFLLNLVQDLH
jgi:hypothetical protein